MSTRYDVTTNHSKEGGITLTESTICETVTEALSEIEKSLRAGLDVKVVIYDSEDYK